MKRFVLAVLAFLATPALALPPSPPPSSQQSPSPVSLSVTSSSARVALGSAPLGYPVDTIINLVDQRPTVNWAGNLWILGRRASKSARGGTRTRLTMCLPGALQF
jgi:hypothetical protein